jgi:hypothetical protein
MNSPGEIIPARPSCMLCCLSGRIPALDAGILRLVFHLLENT